jgi:hypothetical protein
LWLKRLHHNLLHCVEGLFCISFSGVILGAKIQSNKLTVLNIELGFTQKFLFALETEVKGDRNHLTL